MKRLLALLLLVASNAFAYDVGTNYNTANMSYTANSTIQQVIVFNNTMRAGGTFSFTVDARAGGGPGSDTANVRITFLNSANTVLGTSISSTYNLGGDATGPWQTLNITSANCTPAASCADVAYARITMMGTDTSWWAGNYGPQWRLPTLTHNGGGNLAYNPEFGNYNTTIAQGWTSSTGWGTCGTVSGSVMCVTSASGVTANVSGEGYRATGGTTTGQEGGYTSTLTVADANPGTGGSAPAAPTLCCGGSAASFLANATNAALTSTFVNRTTNDSRVYIEQIGTGNTILVEQTGTKNNYTNYYGNGSNNNVSVTQSGNNSTTVNYANATVAGNSNSVTVQQQSTGGSKGAFVTVNDNNNTLLIQQKDAGSHYAEVTLSGGNKNVDILQQGAAGHMAKVELTGLARELSLTQSGNTTNYYSISSNCTTSGGCAKITVVQGQ